MTLKYDKNESTYYYLCVYSTSKSNPKNTNLKLHWPTNVMIALIVNKACATWKDNTQGIDRGRRRALIYV